MNDYVDAVNNFSVAELEKEVLHGSLSMGLNACIECCERWAMDGAVALEWYGASGGRQTVTFAQLKDDSAHFANFLTSLGIGQGDVVAGLLSRIPDLMTVFLGAWSVGAVYQPLFTAFGPAAVASRVTAQGGSQAKLIVTDVSNRPKLNDVADCPPTLVVGNGFTEMLLLQSSSYAPVMMKGTGAFIMLFTSGTTGKPKGVRYPLSLLLPIAVYMSDAVDLQPTDACWNVADPGLACGML